MHLPSPRWLTAEAEQQSSARKQVHGHTAPASQTEGAALHRPEGTQTSGAKRPPIVCPALPATLPFTVFDLFSTSFTRGEVAPGSASI